MDYMASNPELWNRQIDSGAELPRDDAFESWLNGYLAEVLPAQHSEQEALAQMPLLPDVPPQRFPWEKSADPAPGHDIGSSNSGETPYEQAPGQARPSDEHEPHESKADNKASRVADKNRFRR